ncbi:HAD family hydrolase [Zunongwangia pacifica]|uniref:HAD family phosphatase n=1 Tax=Zunongwangia pacifica TaxID=2911062 RepID=A0A9X2CLL0_9FLAO|nr:HAD family phosphatase [Zunongwangia pacifica]MCL6220126.1 HAD family phosphatase [Zunongwangia pacifica]
MIKTIIFDFGDIFINLDKSATPKQLEKFGLKNLPESIITINQEYEKGLISSEEFFNTYKNEFSAIEQEKFLEAWNAILVDFPEYRLEFIKKLAAAKDYQLILLSNTNEIHIDWVKENVPFFNEFQQCFDAFYLSYEINFRKPDANIYKYVLKQHDLKPEECLFIDDTKENTDAAAALGINVWNLEPTREDVIDLFTTKKELFS